MKPFEVITKEDTPDSHRALLLAVIKDERSKSDVAEPSAGLLECHELISKGVPVAFNGPMSVFLTASDWFKNRKLLALFKAYVDAGYLPLNTAPADTLLPLESAIGLWNLDFVRAALYCGADERLVPTPNNAARCTQDDGSGDPVEHYVLADVFALVADEVTSPDVAHEMVAELRAVAMRRHINAVDATDESARPPARRRRSGM